jgi:uncharacterized glyoxalase superfamily protein PhnB
MAADRRRDRWHASPRPRGVSLARCPLLRADRLAVLHYDDAAAALIFLVDAFGFRVALAVPDADGEPIHAELRWPAGGAIVFGSTKHLDSVHGQMGAGTSACYVVTAEVDAVFGRAAAVGAEIIEQPHETTFGSGVPTRAFTARDPEGNLWTFGTYRGSP